MCASQAWVILSGEYPPQPGGVSDYTRMVARGLAAAGDAVQVWAPPVAMPEEKPANGVTVHRLPDCFGHRSRKILDQALGQLPPGVHVLVQYVPHAFGWKGMNLPFCGWLWARRHRCEIVVMFHEVAYPWVKNGRWLRHNFLALITRWMAALTARSAKRICISIPAWGEMLRPFLRGKPAEWLPVPSTVSLNTDTGQVQSLRGGLLGATGKYLVGHFGTFGGAIAPALRVIAPRLLRAGRGVVLVLLGRGSTEFADELLRANPDFTGRIVGVGALEPDAVAGHLAACDLLVQPYPDGVSSRRTSVMASMALGRPIVTMHGFLTEPIWGQSGAVRLVDSPADLAAQALVLLADEPERVRLGAAALALYRERFCVEKIIAQLRGATPVA